MKVYFKYPWLVIDDFARFSVDGRYEIAEGGNFNISNLFEPFFKFVDKLIEKSTERRASNSGFWVRELPNVEFEGAYKIMFAVPKRFFFWKGSKIGDWLVRGGIYVETWNRVTVEIETQDAKFYEIMNFDRWLIDRIINLSIKHKIGLPANFLKPADEGEALIFYDPKGGIALEITDRYYISNYTSLVGQLSEGQLIYDWFKRTFSKNLDENFKNKIVKEGYLIVEAGNFRVIYDFNNEKFEDFELNLGQVRVYRSETGKIVIDDVLNSQNQVDLRVAVENELWKEFDEEFKGILKLLAF